MENFKENPVLVTAIAILVGFIFGYLLPLLGLLTFRGIEFSDFYDKSIFYYSMLNYIFLALFAFAFIQYFVSKNIFPYKYVGWAKVFIHDTNDGLIGISPLGKYVNRYLTLSNIIHFSVIFGLIMGLYAVNSNTFFTHLPATEFQVTNTGKLILSAEPAASAESVLMILVASMILGFGLWYIKIKGYSESTKYLVYLATPVVMTLLWTLIHLARYGAQESNLLSTAIFGFLGSTMTVFLGTIIPWWIWHFFTNLLLKAKELFSSQSVTIAIVIFLIVYIILAIFIKAKAYTKNRSTI